MNAIEAHDVFCLYPTPRGHVAALRGLSLVVPAGQRILVHGPNGSGKTTLLRVLSGERAPSAGLVRVAGVDLVGAEESLRTSLRARRLGLVDQHHSRTLRPELSVLDNVALQTRLSGTPAKQSRSLALAALDSLGLGDLADRAPVTLSGGEAQRIAICAAVAHGPEIVLADEPTGELDRESADAVYDLLARATADRGACLVLVSHDTRAVRIADRVVRIRDGRLSEEWTPGTVGDETLVVDDRGWVRLPEPLRHQSGIHSGVQAVRDGESIVLTASAAALVAADPSGPPPRVPARAALASTGPQQNETAEPDASGAAPVASLTGVDVTRGGRTVLSAVDLIVRAGELTVVQGRSGSGKTTLLRLLAGLERPDSGRVVVDGVDLAELDRPALAALRRRSVAVAAQSGSLIETFDVDENLSLVRDARGLAADRALTDHWVEVLGLAPLRHRAVRVLSGGERQRVGIARVLVAQPRLAILDEPTSQQDEANAERLVAVLTEAARAGLAVVAATHDPVLAGAADHLVRW